MSHQSPDRTQHVIYFFPERIVFFFAEQSQRDLSQISGGTEFRWAISSSENS